MSTSNLGLLNIFYGLTLLFVCDTMILTNN